MSNQISPAIIQQINEPSSSSAAFRELTRIQRELRDDYLAVGDLENAALMLNDIHQIEWAVIMDEQVSQLELTLEILEDWRDDFDGAVEREDFEAADALLCSVQSLEMMVLQYRIEASKQRSGGA